MPLWLNTILSNTRFGTTCCPFFSFPTSLTSYSLSFITPSNLSSQIIDPRLPSPCTMPNRNLSHSSETPAETHNWLNRSTTRTIGRRLLNEPNPSPRRRELTEAEPSSRIRLMRQLPYCDRYPHHLPLRLQGLRVFHSGVSSHTDGGRRQTWRVPISITVARCWSAMLKKRG